MSMSIAEADELLVVRQRLASAQALIRKIQDTVSEAFGPSERWSDFDVLDQGVALLAARQNELILSLAPLLGVKPNFQEVFIPRLNGGMAVCLSCGAFDDQIMIREHRSECESKAEFAALDRLRAAIEALRATPEPPQPA